MKNFKGMERKISTLLRENALLQKNIELRNDNMQNSLFSLVQGAQQQVGLSSPLGSFANLSYYNIYSPITINWTLLTYMYKTHGILQAAIDMPVLDAMRGGLEIHSDELDVDDIKDLQDALEDSGTFSVISEAMVWTRLYGGGALIINTKQDPSTPLNLNQLQDMEIYAANRWEINSPNRYAEYYEFYGQRMHKSRVITMGGKPAPYIVRWTLQGWGMSEMERMIDDFNMYLRTKDVVYELLKEAKIDVYKFKHFTSQLASASGTQMTQNRVQLMNQLKNFNNAVVLDAEDDFEQKQITFGGLADVQKQNMVYIASALRIPMTKLFGLSASGFNSGEDDIENYNSMIESEVRTPLRQPIRKILNLISMQRFGQEFDLNWTFKPLRIMSSPEEETVKTQKHARYQADYNDGILNAQEYAEILQMEKLLPIETEVARGADPEPPQPTEPEQSPEEEKQEGAEQ